MSNWKNAYAADAIESLAGSWKRTQVTLDGTTDEQVIIAANPARKSLTIECTTAGTGLLAQGATPTADNSLAVPATGGTALSVPTTGEWSIVPSAISLTYEIVETM